MTMTTSTPAESGDAPGAEDMVSVTIDGVDVQVPKDTLVIRAAELIGVEIPRFCDHPLLEPVGACRQCLVEVPDAGNGRALPSRRPRARFWSRTAWWSSTQVTSPVADKAQQGNMEFLLINHPLDCPVCDKGGECPLQNQAMSHGRGESRFVETQAHVRQADHISAQVLLDRERCVLLRALHPLLRADRRRPVHRPGRAGGRCSRSGIYERSRSRATSRQHHPDLPR
jgi:NADH-quinone oxidoreductase subunit G